jgi:hypothetical protein
VTKWEGGACDCVGEWHTARGERVGEGYVSADMRAYAMSLNGQTRSVRVRLRLSRETMERCGLPHTPE